MGIIGTVGIIGAMGTMGTVGTPGTVGKTFGVAIATTFELKVGVGLFLVLAAPFLHPGCFWLRFHFFF